MTRRFDRDGNRKHHLQTLCTVAHLDYRQKATHDYSQLFQTLERLGLDYGTREQALCRMIFNLLAANCDDHTKNVSFLLRDRKRRPAHSGRRHAALPVHAAPRRTGNSRRL